MQRRSGNSAPALAFFESAFAGTTAGFAGPSTSQRTLGVHIERIDRLAGSHEQAVAFHAAEAEVGAALGQRDPADHHAVGRIDHDAVELGIAHAPAAPQIAVDVAAHAVGRAGAGVDED